MQKITAPAAFSSFNVENMKKTKAKTASKSAKKGKKVVKKSPGVSSPGSKSPGLAPLGDRVLIKEIESSDTVSQTQSGIYIPDTAKEDKATRKGKVVAVGEGKFQDGKMVPLSLKVGDVVLFQWGEKVNYKGEDYMIVRENEVVAVVRK